MKNTIASSMLNLREDRTMKHLLYGTMISLFFTATVAAKKPNIVFILADDQGWNALFARMDPKIPGSGSTYYQTPRLAKLASEGMCFPQAYSPAPTCGPSRTSIQYGMTPSSVGKFAELLPTNLPPASDAMISRLKAAFPEYCAAHYGKWHQRTRTPEEIGYDDSDGQTINKGNSRDPQDPKLTFSLAKRANAFMTKQVGDGHPFFMQVSFYADHMKYQALPETIKKYEGMADKAPKYRSLLSPPHRAVIVFPRRRAAADPVRGCFNEGPGQIRIAVARVAFDLVV